MTTYHSRILGADWRAVNELPLTGLPSRARLSRDGTLAATTTFVFGDSYANPGQFSTRTLVSHADGASSSDLEQFTFVLDGKQVTAADRNVWGISSPMTTPSTRPRRPEVVPGFGPRQSGRPHADLDSR